MRRSRITSKFVCVVLETSMYFSGTGNDFSLGEQSLSLGSTWWWYVKFPEMDQKSFRASPASRSESWGSGVETLLILQENLFDLLLELGGPVSRWMFSVPDLLQQNLILPLHWVFLSRFPMLPSFPTPQGLRSVRHPSIFPPRTERIQGTIQVRLFSKLMDSWLVFSRDRVYSTNEPTGMIAPSKGSPKRLSYGLFPSDKRSWMFRRQVQHSIESAHQFSSRPDCNNTAEVPSFTLRTTLSTIPFVSDLCGVDAKWFQERSSQALPNSKEFSV